MEVAAEKIFRHGPIIIYTRLPAGGTYNPICTFPASSECLIGISDAFSAFCLRVFVIFPTCSLYPQQKRAYSALHPQARTNVYRSMPEGSYRVQSLDFRRSSIDQTTRACLIQCYDTHHLTFSEHLVGNEVE